MTDNERNLLDDISMMESTAAKIGLCAMPFKLLGEQVTKIISEKDKLAAFRQPTTVISVDGWAGQCPNCKAVFLDPYLPYCGNCGQALVFTDSHSVEN